MGDGGKPVILIPGAACGRAAGGNGGHPVQSVVSIGGGLGAAAAAHGDACVHAVLGIIGIAGLRPAGIRHRADMPPVGHIRGGGGHIGDSLQYPLFPLRGCVGGGNRCNGSVKAVSRHAQRFAGICLAGDPVGSVTVFW